MPAPTTETTPPPPPRGTAGAAPEPNAGQDIRLRGLPTGPAPASGRLRLLAAGLRRLPVPPARTAAAAHGTEGGPK
ncbi:hypothetical protein SAMN05421803_12762 [Nocardiopsis flavescens]|uniref:Uncharacterized protein n=1 Tax=Nocardiopsis flavescens TaxID=758803 RepID=A0A1M6UF58_9ACTN|nr:hypothetical protein [Nocardiopsis flavescens]SHK67773.1 hypothetical protein SAMN05421803_12762 [Nocardiopsis flavescens]